MGREDEIREIAYRIWEEEGRQHGHDIEHWLRAEAIWEQQHKDVLVVTRTKAKTTAKKGQKSKSAVPAESPEATGELKSIHQSLIMKVLGQ